MNTQQQRSVVWLVLFLFVGGNLPFSLQQAQAANSSQAYYLWLNKPTEELLNMGDHFQEEGKYIDSAMICYSIIEERFSDRWRGGTVAERDKRLLVRALNEMGVLNTSYFGNQNEAYKNLMMADEISRAIGYTEMQPYILLNLGNLFNLYEFLFPTDGGQRRSRQYYEQCLAEARRQQLWDMVIASYINLGVLDMPYSIDRELHHNIAPLLNDSIPQHTTDYLLARYFMQGSIALADHHYDEAMALYTQMERTLGRGTDCDRERYMVYMCQATVRFQQGDYMGALAIGRHILDMQSLHDLTDIRTETFLLQAECYEKLDKHDEAASMRIAYLEEKEKLTASVVGLLPAQLNHDLHQVNNEVGKIKKQKHEQLILLFVAIAIIILLCTFALFISKKNRLLKEKNQALYHQMKEIIRMETDTLEGIRNRRRGFASPDQKQKGTQLKEEKMAELVDKIKQAMNRTDDICQPSFTLQNLAEQLDSNTTYLSQAINSHFGMSFTSLLNQYRIREACRRMEDMQQYGKLTIDAIAESVGFKARVTFTKAFKQNVGMLPSEYMKAVKEK